MVYGLCLMVYGLGLGEYRRLAGADGAHDARASHGVLEGDAQLREHRLRAGVEVSVCFVAIWSASLGLTCCSQVDVLD